MKYTALSLKGTGARVLQRFGARVRTAVASRRPGYDACCVRTRLSVTFDPLSQLLLDRVCVCSSSDSQKKKTLEGAPLRYLAITNVSRVLVSRIPLL